MFRAPPSIAPGALVAIVAPSGPFDRAVLFPGLAWLRTRYRLTFASHLLTRSGYFAGDDARRAAELSRAMLDPAVDAILCARGGYGAMRIVDALPWEAFAARPKWLAGFSDVTALHVELAARGIRSVHSMNGTGLGAEVTPWERMSLLRCLEGMPADPWTSLEIVHAGKRSAHPTASGPIFGGNLALVYAMAAAGRLVVPDNAIVVLEDITEKPYRVDRMLTSLRMSHAFRNAAAIIFGDFAECLPGPDGVTVGDVIRDRTGDLGIPVLSAAPFGHSSPNSPFTLGANGTLDGTTLRFD